MKRTLERYRQAVQSGQADPVRSWDGRSSRTLLDSRDERVPLSVLNLDAFALTTGGVEIETAEREWVIVPIDCEWRAEVAAAGTSVEFSGDRAGGPFVAWPTQCNAQAVYVPRGARVRVSGRGEAIGFSGPAFADKPPARLACGPDRPMVSRGSATWRRDVVTLASPSDVTSNLVVGETYSPPGLWSGTPLHVHDQASGDESDHEEIYYHLTRRAVPDAWGTYGVQLLFDREGLDRAYVIHHRTAFAIPGGSHPVVAGPNGEMMYVWCLGGDAPQPLAMRDVSEFAWLKQVGQIIDRLSERHRLSPLPRPEVEQLACDGGLTGDQLRVLEMHLRQLGFVLAD